MLDLGDFYMHKCMQNLLCACKIIYKIAACACKFCWFQAIFQEISQLCCACNFIFLNRPMHSTENYWCAQCTSLACRQCSIYHMHTCPCACEFFLVHVEFPNYMHACMSILLFYYYHKFILKAYKLLFKSSAKLSPVFRTCTGFYHLGKMFVFF